MINLQNVSLQLSGHSLFQSLNWFIGEGARVGLIGPNGSGKTTLLRLLMGNLEPDEGTIDLPRHRSMGYLPQELTILGDEKLIDYLKKTSGLAALEMELNITEEALAGCSFDHPDFTGYLERHDRALKEFTVLDGFSFQARAHSVLHGLGFMPEESIKRTTQFSGGWQMKILLAALLIKKPDILLLDEPTNHLDTENLEWLEVYLTGYQGTIVTVSHDRRFLDTITTETALLRNRTVSAFTGGYTKSMEIFQAQHAQREKERFLQNRFLEKERLYIDRFRYKASKASLIQSRIKRLEKMDLLEEESESERIQVRFPDCERSNFEVLNVSRVSKWYGDLEVLREISFSIFRGEKVALVGPNGVGKSTLARLISGIERPDHGRITLGQKVKNAYFSQESAKNLDFTRTVWEEIDQYNPRMSESAKRSLLGAFLFSGDTITKPISVLSGGEKARLSLLKLLLQDTNFLVLDEPTNHLDITTCELFQQALEGYQGTVLIISHDRHLLDRVVTRVLAIRNGGILEYPGNYSDFLSKWQHSIETNQSSGMDQLPEKSPASNRERVQKREEAERRNRIYREKRSIQEKLDPLEQAMTELERQKQEKERLLGNPDILKNSGRVSQLMVELNDITQQQDNLLDEWEKLLDALEGVDKGKKA